MLLANTSLDVTKVSFDANREAFKTYLKRQSKFRDYNFEGSTLALMLDMFAYASYGLGFYANMAANEGHMDTAVLRDSVVSRAKNLSYVPRSAKGARAVLRVSVIPNDTPAQVTIAAGTKFESIINGETFRFQTLADYVFLPTGDGSYTGNIEIVQGIEVSERYTIGTEQQRYRVMNVNCDTDTLTVKVRPSQASSLSTTFTRILDITEAKSNTNGYYLEGDFDSRYVVQFGDNIIGRRLVAGEYLTISYLVTEGARCNGIQSFKAVGNLGGYSTFSFTVVEAAAGGQDEEDIESIRFHAPRNYELQGRVVTAADYKEFVLANHSDIQAIAVWGGEDNDPPIYGRVFIALKPFNGFVLPQYRKNAIFNQLDKYNVQAIEPIVVDATFLYLKPTIRVFYDSTATLLDAAAIYSKVSTALLTYEATKLGNFDQKVRHTEISNALLAADATIRNVEVDTEVQKRFSPIINSTFSYTLNFHQPLYHPIDGNPVSILSASPFTLPAYSQSMQMDDDGSGNVRFFYIASDGRKIIINAKAGTIDYDTGKVTLINFAPSSFTGSELKITVKPRYPSFSPVRNQIVLVSDAVIAIYRETQGRDERPAYSATPITQGTSETLLESGLGG